MDWRELLIDTPGWALGQMLGSVLHLMSICGIFAAAIFAGLLVYRSIRIPVVAHALGIFAGAWLLLVLHRAEVWMAATWIKTAELTDYED